ncbi:Phage integrase, N-terminal SAM-like domain [Ruaniaceae bacterium KH17]|nr:Phage integrase, N-terminal SAM-like domain [Ruaniaceae bacterium KH17]
MRKKGPDNLPRGIDFETRTRKDGTPYTNYRVRVYWQYRQIVVGRYEDLTVARAALRRAQLEVVNGTFVPPADRRRTHHARLAAERANGTTVEEWFERWIGQLENDKLHPRSPATLVSYRSTITAWILPELGDVRLVDVKPAEVQAIVDAAASRGPGAANNVVRHFRAMMNAAVAEGAGGLTVSPLRAKPEKAGMRKRSDDEVPTLAEVAAITANMPERLRLAPELAVWAALRVGEVLGLQRGDLRHLDDPAKAELHVRRQWNVKGHGYGPPKDESAGAVSLPAVVVPAIREHLERYVLDGDDAPVFPSVQDRTRPVSYNSLQGAWVDAREGARHPFALHSLRHLGLTIYAQQGATSAEIQRRGRHKDAAASARYQHASVERDRALTAKMSATQEGGGK